SGATTKSPLSSGRRHTVMRIESPPVSMDWSRAVAGAWARRLGTMPASRMVRAIRFRIVLGLSVQVSGTSQQAGDQAHTLCIALFPTPYLPAYLRAPGEQEACRS